MYVLCLLNLLFQLHEFDALRFDIRGHGSTFFLRASTEEEKQNWVDAIENSKVGDEYTYQHLPRHHFIVCRLMSWRMDLAH